MNKRGFTLIELLSSITIMTLIATMASINLVNIFSNKEKENLESKKNIITTAACLYIELEKNNTLKELCLTRGCDVSTNTLINEGLLNDGDVDKSQVIHISKVNNEKKCVIK